MKKIILIIILINHSLFAELISPIEDKLDINLSKALLGKRLFFEKRLSSDNTISCANCHIISEGGDDNKRFSIGVNNKKGSVNSPTVLNSRYNFVQFWDGRAKDLKEQAMGPIHNPVEMNSHSNEVVQKLKKDASYVKSFKTVFNSEITFDFVLDAIVEFEKALITPNSKFDQYLKGDKTALNDDEKEGFELFKSYGCISCHNGVNLGGNLFQQMGILKIMHYEKNKYLGRYNVTKNEEDRYFYKVPTLRNIEHTAPYLHSGTISTLKETIEIMLEYQVGIKPKAENVEKILSFLKTLTGEQPKIMDMN
ncbi:MAG: cytochrome-c peroxidase [Candidatus Marinarcus sp.]|uniref:cytochrome-c peroxidase n=1 Tax=Candidatus Marinarcus sp. TaxID=3100987 RepID=UPI003B00E4EE